MECALRSAVVRPRAAREASQCEAIWPRAGRRPPGSVVMTATVTLRSRQRIRRHARAPRPCMSPLFVRAHLETHATGSTLSAAGPQRHRSTSTIPDVCSCRSTRHAGAASTGDARDVIDRADSARHSRVIVSSRRWSVVSGHGHPRAHPRPGWHHRRGHRLDGVSHGTEASGPGRMRPLADHVASGVACAAGRQ